jgi:hypothetical protein
VLQKELDSLKTDTARYAQAGDTTALQTIILPRLKKLHGLVTGLPKLSTQADADLAAAAKLLMALDHTQAAELLARLAALKDQKASAWPSGATLDEIAASVDTVSAGAKALIADGEALKTRLVVDREIAALRAKLDAFKPRIDKASEAPVPPYIDERQNNVKHFAQVMDEQLNSRHVPEAQKTLAGPGGGARRHGEVQGPARRLPRQARRRQERADQGGARAQARTTRPRRVARQGHQHTRARDRGDDRQGGVRPRAERDRRLDRRRRRVGTGQGGLRQPAQQGPEDRQARGLADKKGGKSVLDSLVADLPPNTPPKVLITALKARLRREGGAVHQAKARQDRRHHLGHRRKHQDRSDQGRPDPGSRPRRPVQGARQGAAQPT